MAKVLCTKDTDTGIVEEIAGLDLLNGFSGLKKITIEDAIDKYIQIYSKHKSTKQYKNELLYFGKFSIQVKDKKYLHELTSEDIEIFQGDLLKKVKAASVIRRLATFKHFFNCCINWGYLYKNPCRGTKKLKEEKNNYTNWSEKEFFDFINTADGEMGLLFQFLWHTGCRPSELLNLKWSDVDYENKVIYFTCGKNAHIRRDFPLWKEVDEILHKLKFDSAGVFRPQGKTLNNDKIYQYAKHRLNALNMSHLTVYGIRHSFASRLSNLGLNAFDIKYLMGHANIRTTLNYIHQDRNVLIDKLNSVYSKAT